MSGIQVISQLIAHIIKLGEENRLPIETKRPTGRPPNDENLIADFKQQGVEEGRVICSLICAIDSGVISGTYE